jgi:O-antigen ligase
MQRGKNISLLIFCISLLFLASTIRSGILVDRSFIPRFLLLSLTLLIALIAGEGRSIRIRNNLFETAFILFYGWSLLSAFWSIEGSESVLSSQLVFLALALFLVTAALVERHPGFENIFIKTHLLVLLFSFGLAFYKMSLLPYYDPYKIISVSANNNLYSGFLVISFPLVFSGYILLKKAWKYLSVAVGILLLFFIIIIQSRAAFLGTIAALLISVVVLKIRYPVVFSKKNIFTGIFALILLSSGIGIFTQTLDYTRRQYFLQKIMVWEYFRSYEDLQARNILRLRQADLDDHTKLAAFDYSEDYYANANLRVIFWKKSLGLIASRPLTGVGAGNWRLAVPSIKDPPNPEHTIGNYTYSEPHNEWIRIISELGIPGFILAFFVFFLPPGFVIYSILFSRKKIPVETLFYAAFIAGFFLFASFDFPLRRVEHNIVLWSVFAFMLNKVPLPSMQYAFFRKIPAGWLTCILAGLLLVSVLISVARFRGEYFTIKMFRSERKEDNRVITFCRKAENPFYHITPNTLPLPWFEGVAHFRLGENELAEKCFQRALKMTPGEVRVLNDYSAVLFKLGKQQEAIKTLKETLSIDPFFDDARFNLGAIYFLTGMPVSAREQISQCRESQKKKDYLEEMK